MAISRLSQNTLQNAFSKYNNIWDGRSAVGAMDSLGAYTFTTDSSTTVTFSNIPQTYTSLQLRWYARASATDYYEIVVVSFNGDTAANYSYHTVYNSATSGQVNASGAGSQSSPIYAGWCSDGASSSSGVFGVGIMDIFEYTNTNKAKVWRTSSGFDNNAAGGPTYYYRRGASTITSGSWYKSGLPAISSISIQNSSNTSWKSGTVFSLYGIK